MGTDYKIIVMVAFKKTDDWVEVEFHLSREEIGDRDKILISAW